MATGELRGRIEALSAEQRRLLELRLRRRKKETREETAIPRVGQGPQRLSFAQERLWFIDRLEAPSGAYNLAWAWRLSGRLDTAALQKALNAVVARHEVLRTVYREIEGVPFQFVEPARPVEMLRLDLPARGSDEDIRRVLSEQAGREFNLAGDLMIRSALLRLQPQEHVLLLTVHHIAVDGWSQDILLHDLSAFYAEFAQAKRAVLPELPISYSDFAAWQRQWMDRDECKEHLAYWTRHLEAVPETLNLPLDYPRPAVQGYRGARESLVLPGNIPAKLEALHHQENATLFMTLLAVFQALLYRYTQQTDLAVGAAVADRRRVETEGLVGFLVNTVVMRTDLSGAPTFRELLRRVRAVALDAYAHQDVPFERVVDALRLPRRRSHNPIFQVMLSLVDTSSEDFTLSGLAVEPIEVETGGARLDLALAIVRRANELTLTVTYNTDLFAPGTAARMLQHFQQMLQGAILNPDLPISKLPLLTERERQQLVVDWNQTAADYPQATALELFESYVARTPDAVAVVSESGTCTYAELDCMARRIAVGLRTAGVQPGSLVAICAERSARLLGGLLGIWKAGAAYLPVDASHPKDRVAYMFQDARPAVVLTQRGLRDSLPDEGAPFVFIEDCLALSCSALEDAAGRATMEDLAYVLYTSGSTGKPKGVAVRHRSLTNLLDAMRVQLDATSRDTMLAATTLAFDVAGMELFLAPTVGARVAVIDRAAVADGLLLEKMIDKLDITIALFTPTAWQTLLETGWKGKEGFKMICGGETLPKTLAEQLMRCGRVCHAYGPTETTMASTAIILSPADECISIGRPLSNTQLYILDPERQPVPIGVPGELYIGGIGVADGYWNRPDLTAERFVANPFDAAPGSRLYKTGDLTRYRSDGNVEFLGRIDTQVKVRGFRIELGEIETVLLGHEAVRKCAVAVRQDDSGDKQLVAYCEADPDAVPADADLRAHLKRSLPEYMVPSAFVCVPALPTTPTGKIDRNALPALDRLRPAPVRADTAAPRDAIERGVANIWRDVLGVEHIGLRDNFYTLGGNSLKAVQICFRVRNRFGMDLPLSLFYEDPTVQGIATFIAAPRSHDDDRWAVWECYRKEGTNPPLFAIHAVDGIFTPIAKHVSEQFPFHTVTCRVGFDGQLPPYYPCQTVEEMAERYLKYIRSVRPQGPYFLAGFCGGGLIAYEVARRLSEAGEQVPFLGLFNSTPFPGVVCSRSLQKRFQSLRSELAPLTLRGKLRCLRTRIAGKASTLARRACRLAFGIGRPTPEDAACCPGGQGIDTPQAVIDRVVNFGRQMYTSYSPRPYDGKIWLFYKATSDPDLRDRWARLAAGVEAYEMPGEHITMMEEPNVRQVAAALNASLTQCLDAYRSDSFEAHYVSLKH